MTSVPPTASARIGVTLRIVSSGTLFASGVYPVTDRRRRAAAGAVIGQSEWRVHHVRGDEVVVSTDSSVSSRRLAVFSPADMTDVRSSRLGLGPLSYCQRF